MSNMGFAGVANYAPVTSGTAVREMAVTGVAGSSIAVQGPALALNFLTAPVGDLTLDPRITFTRATDATYIDSAGDLVSGPSNLLRYSEELDQAAIWTVIQATILANAVTAPDGTLTAEKLVENTAVNVTHIVRQNFTTQNLRYTFSVYAKAAGRNHALLFNGQSGTGQIFDLTTGQPVTTSTGVPVAASGELVGNGWCRISITVNCTENVNDFRVYTATGPGTNTWIYTGDGVSGIYVWGAQLNRGALQSYNKTTTAPYYGPRFDYSPTTLAPLGLLIEEARTNSIRNNTMQGAVAGTPGTVPTNWAISSGGLSSEVLGTGTQNGINYIDVRFNGTTTGANAIVYFESFTQIVAEFAQTWTSSFWFSVVGGSTNNVTTIVESITERTAAGAFLVVGVGPDIKNAGSTFTRSSFTRTLTNASTARVSNAFVVNFASGVAIDITIRIGLPQLERGPGATSVIPTTTTALTRALDVAVMTGTNFSDWFNPVEGTFVANYDTVGFFDSVGSPAIIAASDQTILNRIQLSHLNGPTRRAVVSTVVSVFDDRTTGQSVAGVPSKFAIAYKTDDFAACANGGTVATDNLGALPTVDRFYVGQDYGAFNALNGHVRSVAYYPRRLPNAELQGLTA